MAAAALYGGAKLIRYGMQLSGARQTSAYMQAVYAEAPTALPTEAPTALPTQLPQIAVTFAPWATPGVVAPAGPTATPFPRLRTQAYPENPDKAVAPRLQALRKENKDVVGYLRLDHLLEEAVVQRDNVYYLTHDALKKENVNGAIFLDAAVALKTRPYTYLLYGHNMKSGAMFGCLRNYEKASFYHSSPFITFDSLYEEGRYVIFAVSSVSVEPGLRGYVDFFALTSDRLDERQAAIVALIAASVHTCAVDVEPEDQLLLLVTCSDREENRRIVAARRIRDGETEGDLKALVGRTRKK